jgi:hypothetical protein
LRDRANAGFIRCASPIASPGGQIDRKKSASPTSASSSATGTMRARSARAALAAERPASEVVTFTPCSASRAPTAAPMSPAAMIATT